MKKDNLQVVKTKIGNVVSKVVEKISNFLEGFEVPQEYISNYVFIKIIRGNPPEEIVKKFEANLGNNIYKIITNKYMSTRSIDKSSLQTIVKQAIYIELDESIKDCIDI